ncbi:hypothetical protein CCACVL1_01626 [Corchorus capsularis]|uniref:Uncharacterized protein n=1 Tax=Corchorus capsularis TaxID=210143 RepID=A0A1R3KGX1_COCAP|nr:hypothetical protein CCACVL1_01626 [Corchorus capsularis]
MATPQFQLSGRKPLQPKNIAPTTTGINDRIVVVNKEGSKGKQILKSKPKLEICLVDDSSNKENLNHHHHRIPMPIGAAKPTAVAPAAAATPTKKVVEVETLDFDSSLAEELSAIRKKMERLRLDKEKTEKMLKDRDALLQFQMKELQERGQIQKQFEIEVDRLFRLKELKSYCMRISPIKSLRERQQDDKRIYGGHSLVLRAEESEEESVGENTLQSPTPSDSSEVVRENDNNDDDDE